MAQLGTPSSQASGSARNWLYLFRSVILFLCSVLNVSTLGLIVHWLVGSIAVDTVYGFEIIGVITAVLTLVVIPTMLIISRVRKNAWFVYIATEAVVFGVLWVLWTVTAALVIQDFDNFYFGISCSLFLFPEQDWCNQLSAIKGLAVTIFVLLLLYVLTLVTYAIVHTLKGGSGVWLQTVQEQTLWTYGGSGTAVPATESTAPGSPSMWDNEKPATGMHPQVIGASVGGNIPGQTFQASPAPSSGVATYPPSTLSQALTSQMSVANSAGAGGPNMNVVGSNMTSFSDGAGVGPGAGIAQGYYSPAPQQVNMHVSKLPPQQQGAGIPNVMGNHVAPVTPSLPQL